VQVALSLDGALVEAHRLGVALDERDGEVGFFDEDAGVDLAVAGLHDARRVALGDVRVGLEDRADDMLGVGPGPDFAQARRERLPSIAYAVAVGAPGPAGAEEQFPTAGLIARGQ
jgi:hypothetical protein